MMRPKKIVKEYYTRYVANIKLIDQDFYPTINDLIGAWSSMEMFVNYAINIQQ